MTPRTEAQEARNTTRHHIGERRIEDALPGEANSHYRRAFGLGRPLPARDDLAPLTRAEFGAWLSEYYGRDAKSYSSVIEGETEDKPLTKGYLADAVWKLMQVAPPEKSKKK